MTKLTTIRIKGFRSYRAQVELDLSEVHPGFYLVRGANGAGKSSFFDAVYWTLFGETSRGLRASSINNWGSQAKGSCECSIVLDGKEVSRGWSPNYLRLDGTEIDQPSLETALGGLSPSVALNTVYFSQFAPFFLDLKPPQRMELYSQVLNLELWEQKSELANKLSKEFAKDAADHELEEARLRERASTLLAVDFEASIAAWKRDQALKVKALEKELKTAEAASAEAVKLKVGWESKAAKVSDRLASTKASLVEDQRLRSKLQGELEDVIKNCARADAAVHSVILHLKEFDELGEGECPACAQPVPKEHRAAHQRKLRAEKKRHEAVFEHHNQARKLAQADLKKVEARIEASGLAALEKELATLQSEIRMAAREVQATSDDMTGLTKRIEALKKEGNPFERQRRENETNAAVAARQADTAKGKLQDARAQEAAFAFWTKGFKDVRFQVMQESLLQLNAEVNECLHDLGLEGWRMTFEVEQETKRGTVKRGFLCTVQSPESPEEGVPWEAWSGGESQRLRMAAQMGVANMVAARLGLSPDFEFWDEPSNWLNDEGIKDMLEVLRERAERYGRRIFLADHRALDFDFDGTLDVYKTDEGSELSIT